MVSDQSGSQWLHRDYRFRKFDISDRSTFTAAEMQMTLGRHSAGQPCIGRKARKQRAVCRFGLELTRVTYAWQRAVCRFGL